jgi:hypothetical protein
MNHRHTMTQREVDAGNYGVRYVTTPHGRLDISPLLGKFERADVGRVIVYQTDDDGKPMPRSAYLEARH